MNSGLDTTPSAPLDQRVLAPIVGNIWQIKVDVGDQVEAGQTLIMLESMKMEIPIPSPIAGVVSEVPVAVTQIVQEGDTVAVISG